MWGLEYCLLFGLPKNKLEFIDGRSHCVFPFTSREQAEHHFVEWLHTLRRWQRIEPVAERRSNAEWAETVPSLSLRDVEKSVSAEASRSFQLRLRHRPIELLVPFHPETFHALATSSWRVELWDDRSQEIVGGMFGSQRHFDVGLNLWSRFEELELRHGGQHATRLDVILSDATLVQPDFFYYGPQRKDCLVDDAFFQGPPDFVVEVLSPASRDADCGPRKELYRRAGVPHLWLVDPHEETVERYELADECYQVRGVDRTGDVLELPCVPGETLSLGRLFDTQWKRHGDGAQPRRDVPEWIVPREVRVGLEHLLLMGHKDRRYEIWNNRAPCVLPFGSDAEAKQRFRDVLEDICRWEECDLPATTAFESGCEMAEVGRFRLVRRRRRVSLDVAVDARKYEQLARVWHRRGVWKWDEE